MNVQHTPGPWEWDDMRTKLVGHKGAKVLQDGEGMWDLCSCVAVVDDKPERARSNARLIAAAPDLLEALRRVVNDWVEPDGLPFEDGEMPALDAARAAIAKATGEAK